ncbi:MAG: hypothetical protein LUH05_02050 [Candidatus Gastranaerophilales bacterium]|nr:hypothetical protein [Candidatus Gastranaerophilales bacterium]
MQIGKLSLHTTKSADKTNAQQTNKASNKLSTNPFGVSFKGNVIQADVFEGTKQASNGIAEKSKMFASAVVSGINNFNESFKSRMNSIVSFGKKVTTDVFDKIEKIGSTEITFDMEGIKNKLFPDREYSVKNLTNKSVDELHTMWTDLTPAAV